MVTFIGVFGENGDHYRRDNKTRIKVPYSI